MRKEVCVLRGGGGGGRWGRGRESKLEGEGGGSEGEGGGRYKKGIITLLFARVPQLENE